MIHRDAQANFPHEPHIADGVCVILFGGTLEQGIGGRIVRLDARTAGAPAGLTLPRVLGPGDRTLYREIFALQENGGGLYGVEEAVAVLNLFAKQ